jgi:hypothetical protein
MIRDDGKSGWLVKGIANGFWKICHIDTSGAVRLLFTDANVNTGGSSYSGVRNGNIVVNNIDTGYTFLYDKSGTLISSKDVWNDPAGWTFSHTMMGSVAGLIDGNIAVLPELGAGAGYTPYVYIYDSNLNLIKKSDISSEHILVYSVVGLSSGGFAGLGNTDGSDYDTHLFYFNADGSLASRYDLRANMPSLSFMSVGISATEDGGVIVTQYNGSKVWIFHSPPQQVDLAGTGVTNIGGVGGSYFQAEVPTLITLSSFTATPSGRKVTLSWTTESEIDNAGFNLYRAESEDGKYVKINDSLIPAEGSTTQGATYQFVDDNVKNRNTYYYKLEDLDLDGTSTMHGPVSTVPKLLNRRGR